VQRGRPPLPGGRNVTFNETEGAEGSAANPELRPVRMFEGVCDQATFILGPQGTIETWSSGAEHVTGFRPEEAIGQHLSILYLAEDITAGVPHQELARAEALGQYEAHVRLMRKDGSTLSGHLVVTTMRLASGQARGYVVVIRDLASEQRAAEALRLSDERFRLMVESVRDYAIFMLDPGGRVMTWNAGAERIKGYRAHEIIGEHFSRFYPEADIRAGKCERELEIASADGRFEEEGWRLRKDGKHFWANVVITALRDSGGRLVGFTKVTRDLTQRRKLEDERLLLAQAEESIRLRDEFLSIASHELKTPLTALQLQLQGLHRRIVAVDPSLAARIERGVRSGQRLADLIEALLDVSRIATGRFELKRERFDLSATVHEVVDRLRESAAREGSPVTVVAPRGVIGSWDRLRLEQVLTNLLANAIKYGKGGPIEVALTVGPGEVVLHVSDRGPGVPEQDLQRIFGRFERASSLRNYGGLGLGLYVARQIIEAHGGSVSARNLTSGGASFSVRLPLAPRQPDALH
jgi:PAS domain S-box-containing protein